METPTRGERAASVGRTERHHRIPRSLLASYDRMIAPAELDAEALALWFEHEGACFDYGIDPDASREEIRAAIEASVVTVTYEEHRRSIHAADWARWGRKGGLATLVRYGRGWFHLLAKRRWGGISAAELAGARAAALKGEPGQAAKADFWLVEAPGGGERRKAA